MNTLARDLSALLPDSLPGWEIKEEHRYTPDNLYDYIDGGAELYRSYGFREMVSLVYHRPDQPDLYLDIFDMGTTGGAFGVFTHSREKTDSTFGQGSQYSPGALIFWKDRYFISLLASPETPEARQAIFTLARQIEHAIPRQGKIPTVVRLLPRDSLVEESIRYFYHPVWLNTYFFLTESNLLHLDSTTQAVWAKYRFTAQPTYLLLVLYPSASAARTAEQEFRKFYFTLSDSRPITQTQKGSWDALRRCGRLLVGIFRARNSAAVQNLLEEVCRKQPSP